MKDLGENHEQCLRKNLGKSHGKSRRRYRCAIYTRKSNEEGLDQSFNSLDAQREACEAYIQSQAGLGWDVIHKLYDDGGISGGHMERPGLQALLADIRAGQVDVVVVYKVDRLTRSITDFGRLVEVFDGQDVSFVSVTQAFNTTNSMGRLTLNVLLSFAQFEREVTAERIRDKIASSKQKGMWMGGRVPYGYLNRDRQLHIKEDEAATVRLIFDLYLKHRNGRLVKEELERKGIRTRMSVGTSSKAQASGRSRAIQARAKSVTRRTKNPTSQTTNGMPSKGDPIPEEISTATTKTPGHITATAATPGQTTPATSSDKSCSDNKPRGGIPFTTGHVHRVLTNPLYIGKVRHKDKIYEGQHQAIIDEETWNDVQSILKENGATRHHKTNFTSPGWFKGLLHDENGTPFVVRHGNKKGRRYYYYVTKQSVKDDNNPNGHGIKGKDLSNADNTGRSKQKERANHTRRTSNSNHLMRLPVGKTDALIQQTLINFLRDEIRLTELVRQTQTANAAEVANTATATDIANLVQKGRELADRIASASELSSKNGIGVCIPTNGNRGNDLLPVGQTSRSQRELLGSDTLPDTSIDNLLHSLIERITISPSQLNIRLNAEAISINLDCNLPTYQAPEILQPINIKRCGHEMKLVIGGIDPTTTKSDLSLLQLIANAHLLRTELENQTVTSIKAFAKKYSLDHGDAKNLLPLAYLAPTIIETILTGTQPVDLTTTKLKQISQLPIRWNEQKTVLGYNH